VADWLAILSIDVGQNLVTAAGCRGHFEKTVWFGLVSDGALCNGSSSDYSETFYLGF
jgi:hypothetical protein